MPTGRVVFGVAQAGADLVQGDAVHRRTVMLALSALPVLSYSEVTGAGLQIEKSE